MCRSGLSDVRGSFRHEELEDFAVLTEGIWTLQLLKRIFVGDLGRHTLNVYLSSLPHSNIGFELNPLRFVLSPLVSQLLCCLQPLHPMKGIGSVERSLASDRIGGLTRLA
jgi:hypothetical protein